MPSPGKQIAVGHQSRTSWAGSTVQKEQGCIPGHAAKKEAAESQAAQVFFYLGQGVVTSWGRWC